MRLHRMSEKEVTRHKEECREVRESGEVSEFAVIAWGERVRELESELAKEKRKVKDLEYGRLTMKEDLENVVSLTHYVGTVGDLVLSVTLLLSGMFGVVGGVWGGSFSGVGAGVCFIVIAWLACFLECRRLMKRMNEVWYKLDLVLQGKRASSIPEVSAAQVWHELHEKHERERRKRVREKIMNWLFVLVALVIFYFFT